MRHGIRERHGIIPSNEQDQSIAWLAQDYLHNGIRLDGLVRWAVQTGELELAGFAGRAEREAPRLSGRRAESHPGSRSVPVSVVQRSASLSTA
jgi:hypothetical protein